MRKLLLLLLLTPIGLYAQNPSPVTGTGFLVQFPGTPTGSCTNDQMAVNVSNAALYNCLSGAWHAVGGGAGTVTGGPFASGNVVTGAGSQAIQDSGTALSALALLASPTFTGTVTLPTVTNTGAFTNSFTGAASTPGMSITGVPFAGTGTTSTPQLYINTTGSTQPTTWNTGGTLFGGNQSSTFTGNIMDFRTNGGATINFSVSNTGALTVLNGISLGGGFTVRWASRSGIISPVDSQLELVNAASTAFSRLQFGGTTSAFGALCLPSATILQVCGADGTVTAGNTSILQAPGNKVFVTGDFTTAANTNLQTITGLTFNLPATALNYNFTCHLAYSQATAVAAVAFGVQAATNAPTNIMATARMQVTAGPPSTYVSGTLATLNTTTATSVVSATPGVIATLYEAELSGTLENPASANAFNIMVSTATSGDAVTVKRGSSCQLY